MDESLPQQRLDREQLLASHALDLLDDVLPVHLAIDPFTAGETAQQLALALGPQQDVILIKRAHRLRLDCRRPPAKNGDARRIIAMIDGPSPKQASEST
jgi:hypothetical protein